MTDRHYQQDTSAQPIWNEVLLTNEQGSERDLDRDRDTPLSPMEEAEIVRLRSEAERNKAEIRQLELMWWKKPVFAAPIISLAAAALLFLTGLLSGYFDTQTNGLRTEISELTRNRNHLQSTELSLRQLLNATEQSYTMTSDRLHAEAERLEGDVAGLRDERGQLYEAISRDNKKSDLLLELFEAGGQITVKKIADKTTYSVVFDQLRVTQSQLSANVPFLVPIPHTNEFVGDSEFSRSDDSLDVSKLMNRALALLNIGELEINCDRFTLSHDCLVNLAGSGIEKLGITGEACNDNWLALLSNSSKLKAIAFVSTSVTPGGLARCLNRCRSIETVVFYSVDKSLAALDNRMEFPGVTSLYVSCDGSINPEWLSGFTSLSTLALGSHLSNEVPWPKGFASTPGAILMEDINESFLGHLAECRQLRYLKFNINTSEQSKMLKTVLPRLSLRELHVDCGYQEFPVDWLIEMPRLTSLSISHARLDGSLRPLQYCKTLERIIFHGSPVSDSQLSVFGTLPNLKYLDLSDTHAEGLLSPMGSVRIDQGLAGIAQSPTIRTLDLQGYQLTPHALSELAGLRMLESLSVSADAEDIASVRQTLVEALPDTNVLVSVRQISR